MLSPVVGTDDVLTGMHAKNHGGRPKRLESVAVVNVMLEGGSTNVEETLEFVSTFSSALFHIHACLFAALSVHVDAAETIMHNIIVILPRHACWALWRSWSHETCYFQRPNTFELGSK